MRLAFQAIAPLAVLLYCRTIDIIGGWVTAGACLSLFSLSKFLVCLR